MGGGKAGKLSCYRFLRFPTFLIDPSWAARERRRKRCNQRRDQFIQAPQAPARVIASSCRPNLLPRRPGEPSTNFVILAAVPNATSSSLKSCQPPSCLKSARGSHLSVASRAPGSGSASQGL